MYIHIYICIQVHLEWRATDSPLPVYTPSLAVSIVEEGGGVGGLGEGKEEEERVEALFDAHTHTHTHINAHCVGMTRTLVGSGAVESEAAALWGGGTSHVTQMNEGKSHVTQTTEGQHHVTQRSDGKSYITEMHQAQHMCTRVEVGVESAADAHVAGWDAAEYRCFPEMVAWGDAEERTVALDLLRAALISPYY